MRNAVAAGPPESMSAVPLWKRYVGDMRPWGADERFRYCRLCPFAGVTNALMSKRSVTFIAVKAYRPMPKLNGCHFAVRVWRLQ